MRILITGAAGFIGSYLMNTFSGNEVNAVFGLDNFSRGNLNRLTRWRDRYMCSTADITKPESYSDYNGVQIIYHLAAQSRIRPSLLEPRETFETNVMGTVNMLELARRTGAHLVFASSSTAGGDVSSNPYAASKAMGEELCRTYHKSYGTRVTIARLFNVYGPEQRNEGMYSTVIGRFAEQFRTKRPLSVTGDGSKKRDFVHVRDVVDGLARIAAHSDKDATTYDIGSGENYSILEVAKMFQPDNIEFVSERRGEDQETLADLTKTKKKLLYYPKHSLPDYIQRIKKT